MVETFLGISKACCCSCSLLLHLPNRADLHACSATLMMVGCEALEGGHIHGAKSVTNLSPDRMGRGYDWQLQLHVIHEIVRRC